MAISVNHTFVSGKAAGSDTTKVYGTHWDADHTLTGFDGLVVGAISVVIDGGGSALTTGLKGYLEVPIDITLTRATLLADQSGSVVVDIFKCTYAQFDASSTHPVVGDKITASAPPTISTATKSQDSTLSGWTTAIAAGSILAFNINSATTVTRVTLSLKYTK